jgi:hypothetical protein
MNRKAGPDTERQAWQGRGAKQAGREWQADRVREAVQAGMQG